MSETTTAAAAEEVGRTDAAGARPGRSRTYPCPSCGADLGFSIGDQKLACEVCGYSREIPVGETEEIREQDYEAALRTLAERKASSAPAAAEGNPVAIPCPSCNAEVLFTGTLESTLCGYCGSPIQRDRAHVLTGRLPVDAVLPFQVEEARARENLRRWVRSRWFAPNDFKHVSIGGRFQGVYVPFWTFDALTTTRYTGERGEHYWTGTGKNRQRRTRWYPASGTFQRFFDDVLVPAVRGLPDRLLAPLEPWPLDRCRAFTPDVLARFQARTYEVELAEGFTRGRELIDRALRGDVRQRIGGDEQRIHSLDTGYEAVTFKHVLLPVWLLAYRYGGRPYRVTVNAGTGEVQGERPWSAVKIALAILAAIVLVMLVSAVRG